MIYLLDYYILMDIAVETTTATIQAETKYTSKPFLEDHQAYALNHITYYNSVMISSYCFLIKGNNRSVLNARNLL